MQTMHLEQISYKINAMFYLQPFSPSGFEPKSSVPYAVVIPSEPGRPCDLFIQIFFGTTAIGKTPFGIATFVKQRLVKKPIAPFGIHSNVWYKQCLVT
jgi:hypothetical protein